MKAMQIFLLILLFSFIEQTIGREICPSRLIAVNRSSTGCSRESVVCCGSEVTFLHLGYCMTYNSTSDTIEHGLCPYIGHYNTTNGVFYMPHVFYIQLPVNVSLLNEFMCGPLNREGELCGKCKDGYGIALYSYTLECSKCWGHGYGWLLYFLLELFPITVMYFLVVIFHIRATTSPLSALVFMSQIVVYTIRLNVPLHMYIENEVTGFPYMALQVLLVLCGVWSLDFFRAVIPPFCVSNNIKTIHALALEYIVAFYPIFLISITYVCIKLHDNNFRPVVWLWKPFHRHFAHFRRRWDSTASIINAFTTFLLLSFSKILSVSGTLLYTHIVRYNYFDDKKLKKCVLYYDPTVDCYTLEYSIFSAVAVCVLVIFIISPTLLLILYPTRLFRKCVSCFGFRRWLALHMFVESFQGQYKDGTNGTWDFRMISALFLILRLLVLGSFGNHHYSYIQSVVQFVLFGCALSFHAVVRPYKRNFSNNADILILVLLATLSVELLVAAYYLVSAHVFVYYVLVTTMLLGVPHMVLILYICYVLAKKVGITQYLKRKCEHLKRCVQSPRHTSQAEADVEADTDSLPDRLLNPERYEPVLPTTEEHETPKSNEQAGEDPKRLNPVYTYGSIS